MGRYEDELMQELENLPPRVRKKILGYAHKDYLEQEGFHRGYSMIGLYDTKNWNNIGTVLRSATNYDVASVMVEGYRYRRSATDTTEYWRHKPLFNVASLMESVPLGCETVCVELTDEAENIFDFVHPDRAFYIFGPEDGSLPKEMSKRADHTIYIPTVHCLNLGMTVHTVLYDRAFKRRESYRKDGSRPAKENQMQD